MARRGGDKIFQRDKEQKREAFKRPKEHREIIPDIIIACEDIASSPNYFKTIIEKLKEDKHITPDSFVIAKHKHSNPSGVLTDLKNHKTTNGKSYKDFTHKWIVIDRDIERVNGGGHAKEDFNRALQQAAHEKVKVAYSNDAFELWYLLHFVYRNTPISRDALIDEVIKKLKWSDEKLFATLDKDSIKSATVAKAIFQTLLPMQEMAIKRAKKLLDSYANTHNPESDNPSTTVHLLVELLNTLFGENPHA